MTPPPKSTSAHRRRYATDLKEQAVALAELTGNASEAARQLSVPTQRVSDWLVHPDNAELRLRIAAKRVETALEIAERLPGLVSRTMAKAERLLEDEEAIRNGTQLLALTTSVGILESVQSRLLAAANGTSRYGSTEPNQALEQQHNVLPALEHVQEGQG